MTAKQLDASLRLEVSRYSCALFPHYVGPLLDSEDTVLTLVIENVRYGIEDKTGPAWFDTERAIGLEYGS